MKTKSLVSLALLVGIGTVLHTVIPGFVFGMKPDMMLTMMFIGIILFREKKYVLLLGVLTGIISGLTTSFPGGFFPNIIDKCITSFAFYGLLLASGKLAKKLPALIVFTAVGTLISGIIFLGSAFFIAGAFCHFVWHRCFAGNRAQCSCDVYSFSDRLNRCKAHKCRPQHASVKMAAGFPAVFFACAA